MHLSKVTINDRGQMKEENVYILPFTNSTVWSYIFSIYKSQSITICFDDIDIFGLKIGIMFVELFWILEISSHSIALTVETCDEFDSMMITIDSLSCFEMFW